MNNNWYVITGGPSTGKTTLLAELEKLGYAVIPEAARAVIDEATAKGISVTKRRKDEKLFQEDVARFKEKVEVTHDAKTLTFFDRGMQDTLAYMQFYNYKIEAWVEKLLQNAYYKKVFLLAPLPVYVEDYARTENENFTKQLHGLLHDAYAKYGMKPVLVPALSVQDRLKFILSDIERDVSA